MPIHIYEVTEKQICEILGAVHEGGPGRPDCRSGAYVVEVKDWARRVHAGIIRATAAKPWAEEELLLFFSTCGFTSGAIAAAEEFADIWLYSSEDGDWDLAYSPDGTSHVNGASEGDGASWVVPAIITGVGAIAGVALLKEVLSRTKRP